jgi:hypothetical protein
MAIRSSSRVAETWRSRTFFWTKEKNDSRAALWPRAPTLRIDPTES